MITRILALTCLVTALMLLPTGLSAHEAAKGPNGGPVVDVAGHHVEFVMSTTEITFFLSGNNHEPIASAGAKMRAIIQDSGKTTQIELVAVDPNRLTGKLVAPLGKSAKVVMSGTLLDGHSLQARFVVP